MLVKGSSTLQPTRLASTKLSSARLASTKPAPSWLALAGLLRATMARPNTLQHMMHNTVDSRSCFPSGIRSPVQPVNSQTPSHPFEGEHIHQNIHLHSPSIAGRASKPLWTLTPRLPSQSQVQLYKLLRTWRAKGLQSAQVLRDSLLAFLGLMSGRRLWLLLALVRPPATRPPRLLALLWWL